MLNSCSSMRVKSQSCIVLFDLLLQQLYGILGQPSYTVGIHLNGLGHMIQMNMCKKCFYRALRKLSNNYHQTQTLPVYLNHLQSVI